jgi:exodeoxyribonuclease VII large subunit
MAREQAGLLFDRLTRAVLERLGQDRRRVERAADALPRLAGARLAAARAGLDAAAGALAVLGPQATLDRGYAIVRRTADGAIVRDPGEAPPGTGLSVRVARGEVAATVDGATRRKAKR